VRTAVLFSILLALAAAAEDGKSLPALEHLHQFDAGMIPESSGVIESPKWGSAGVYWTHPDSKNKPLLYAFTLKGQLLRVVDVMGAKNRDWEDLANDDSGRLIIADIGDNKHERSGITLYRLPEPDPYNKLQRPEIPDVFQYHYPEGKPKEDAEGLVVWKENAFLFSKDVTRVRVYRLALPARAPQEGVVAQAELVEESEMPANVTGAALSEDGLSLALLTYLSVTVIDLKKPPEAGAKFFDPANQKRVRTRLTLLGQSEGIGWSGDDLIITTEGGAIHGMRGVRGVRE